MAKISGFILSTLLVVFCLWLNVFSFPDVIRPDNLAIVDKQSACSDKVDANVEVKLNPETVTVSSKEVTSSTSESTEESSRSSSTPAAEKSKSDESLRDVAEATNLGFSPTSTTHEVGSFDQSEADSKEDKDVLKASGRAQGGKYVSIPSEKMDAFQALEGSCTDRVIGVTRASIPQTNVAM